ncbi:hypothetical protein XA68_17144 [Ophiocordyceps unilateralis]|uniref:Uncharacterized protein n=1 Tax=Ophiocordyceps unilateralis TaxID=268505 RepID=A0A2A9P515_OPHUN|nr:hypothetical protein XA68_17144 [Ophiocordyceps unilateralis]
MAIVAATVSGAAFGAAMTTAGFHDASLIIAQMKLESWHMLQAFMAATASSAACYCLVQRLLHVEMPPPSASSLGLFASHDGNVIGGVLLGAGIALSGSCPGALFAQLAVGGRAAYFTLAGAVTGAVVWAGNMGELVRHRQRRPNSGLDMPAQQRPGLSRATWLLLLQTVCLTVVAMAAGLAPSSPRGRVSGAVAGLLIGFAQLVSLLARRSMLGASGSYQEAGNLLRRLAAAGSSPDIKSKYHGPRLAFAFGAVAGAWLLLRAAPSLVVVPVFEAPPLLAAVGGFLMIVGAAVAGGCTSGHGISGIALLSVPSIVTMAGAFAAGVTVAPLAY